MEGDCFVPQRRCACDTAFVRRSFHQDRAMRDWDLCLCCFCFRRLLADHRILYQPLLFWCLCHAGWVDVPLTVCSLTLLRWSTVTDSLACVAYVFNARFWAWLCHSARRPWQTSLAAKPGAAAAQLQLFLVMYSDHVVALCSVGDGQCSLTIHLANLTNGGDLQKCVKLFSCVSTFCVER